MKKCTVCQETKYLNDFNFDKKAKDGYRHRCKACHAAWMKNYNLIHKEEIREKQRTRDRARPKGSRHGLSGAEYSNMIVKYQGKCWSCKSRDVQVVDHNHRCCPGTYGCKKCVRGLLCGQCNTALGLLQDNPKYIQSLLEYANKY